MEIHVQGVAAGGQSKIWDFSAIPVKGKGQSYKCLHVHFASDVQKESHIISYMCSGFILTEISRVQTSGFKEKTHFTHEVYINMFWHS